MSQDLFSAFGSEPSTVDLKESHVLEVEDDDDFGDFEDASAATPAPVQGAPTANTPIVSTKPILEAKKASFPPKAVNKPVPPKDELFKADVGSHPFAGRMDLLFGADEDDYDAGADELGDLSTNPEAAVAYSKRIIAEQEAAHARKDFVRANPPKAPSKAPPSKAIAKKIASSHSRNASNSDSGLNKLRKKSGYAPAPEPEVLFDADNIDDLDNGYDDFGDFETEANGVSTVITPTARVERIDEMPSMDLLGLDDLPLVTNFFNGTLNSNAPRQTVSALTPKSVSQAPVAPVEDDAWDDFETAAPAALPPVTSQLVHTRTASYTQTTARSESALPPTNIPPPSILLSIFPPLFRSADEALFNFLGKLDLKQRQMLLCHPASHQFLTSYLAHCIVLARIVAGRKLRWKRDQHLTQSMRIGPSAAGGKSGMKLTGVDRSEIAKEDREALDTLDLWRVQVGKLRTAVTAASAAPGLPKLPSVPEVAENMPVRTLKGSEGGISAPHACALCGLKREERVAKVDVEVQDSFGEWWVQGMNMHVGCRRFWDEFEKKLKSR